MFMKRIFLKIESLNPGELEELHGLAENHGFSSPLSVGFKREFVSFFKNGITSVIFSKDRTVAFFKQEDDEEVSFDEAVEFIKSVGKIPA